MIPKGGIRFSDKIMRKMHGRSMSIEDDIAFFERVPTLHVLGRAALRILAIGAESRYVHSGEVLFSAGDMADAGYRGAGRRVRRSPRAMPEGGDTHGGRPRHADRRARAATETARPVTATAREPSTVLRIPRTLFLKMLEGYPDAARKLRDVDRRRAPTQSAPRDLRACARFSTRHGRKCNRGDARRGTETHTSIVAVTGTWSDGRVSPR